MPGHEQEISFTSLGLVVLDEIRFPDQKPLTNILGGSATLGARLFLPGSLSYSLSWMIHVGDDFPKSVEDELRDWNSTLIIQKESDSLSTRGLLEYKDTTFGPKDFRYTTPILGVRDDSLEGTKLLASKAYHYLASPQELQTRVSNLLTLRKKVDNLARSLIIWEPAPLSFKKSIEDLAARVLERGVGPDQQGVVIVRAGEHGCFVSARDISPRWLPPYYASETRNTNISEIVDPTGAGNTFLGAYAIGYLKTGNAIEAACYGSVGASFAIEQVGIPEKAEKNGEEMWNEVSVSLRLREYMSRLL
ncbi:uncharacterized protein N7498_004761 [Penicillium cinerascens]|uniref:Carbohydrate kinase PfkB domain-containing protein n=1 Tax=Penicillium cinerascens TaxID=70096 RepID=A0A9W9SZK8_9EURO|nr:uncharacterized protein N7498_004761 [Penicillium cinerascens]KAJ5203882.1 hypothetical protein N7498_004761 [Penicillium cinerascens]